MNNSDVNEQGMTLETKGSSESNPFPAPGELLGRPVIEVNDLRNPGDLKLSFTEYINWIKITATPDGKWVMRRLDKRSWIKRMIDKLLEIFDR